MANVFSNPTYKSNIGFNDFPIRQEKGFSSTVGHILPVYFDYLHPGDKIDFACDLKTRLQPMVAPAFNANDIEEHIDVFFVPLQQIYHPIGDLLMGIQDFKSDFYSKNGRSTLPTFVSSVVNSFLHDALFDDDNNVRSQLSADDAIIFRCLDHLGFPVFSLGLNPLSGSDWTDVSLADIPIWFACAYQKIWSDHYRLTDWQENDAWLYNFDSWQSNSSTISVPRFKSCFTLHRIPWKRDFHTYTLPSPVFGNGSYNAFGDPTANINQWLSTITGVQKIDSTATVNAQRPTTVQPNQIPVSGPTSSNLWSGLKSFANPASIRTLFAAEKFLEITRRAGKHYDKQVLAHYGINVPTGLDGESMFLGGFTQTIGATDVFSTAETDYSVTGDTNGTPLGKLAGMAFGRIKDGGIKFTAKTEGIFMAVMYVLPKTLYAQTGYDPLNRLVRISDFYNPQFDDLGMQPAFNLYRSLVSPDGNVLAGSSFSSWQWRYMELKSKPSVAFGNAIGNMSPWYLTRIVGNGDSWDDYTVPDNFLNGLMVLDYSDAGPGSKLTEFVNNAGTDRIKAGKALVDCIYSRDPMEHYIKFYVNKVSKMSKFGIGTL